MADEVEREDGQERPSRPANAASRRERRGAARPAGRPDGETEKVRGKAKPAGKPDKSDADAVGRKGKPTPTRDRKDDRTGFFSRIGRFLREVVAELRKVIWPTRKQMIAYTAVVLVFVAFMIALISGLDLALGKGVFWLFG
ncbi:preprotein translocase subunit SecE [Actinokineospora sp. 24-640]